MTIVHVTASPFFGGPERQMLGLALALPARHRSVFLSFPERGLCRPFLSELRRAGIEAIELERNFPHVLSAAGEVAGHLRRMGADLLCCHGYKADLLGWLAASRAGVPVVAVSRGWTGATRKVRLYEILDRRFLRWMDRVVCVSEGQAAKVLRAGVPSDRVQVIRNAICAHRFAQPDPAYRQKLVELVPCRPELVVCAAGRLSPEKGFGQLVRAADLLSEAGLPVGFVVFGDGPLRGELERQIDALHLRDRFVLPGFREDVDRFMPHADLVALPSFTEGLPNVALEASAAGVAVVATAVGGTPEVIADGVNGYLVPAGDPPALARRMLDLLCSRELRVRMGQAGRQRIVEQFTFEAQSLQYQKLFDSLTAARRRPLPVAVLRAMASPFVGARA